MQALKQIRSSLSVCDDLGLVFALPVNIVHCGEIVPKQLLLAPGGDQIDVTAANASSYLRAIERMYLGEGVALQIRALQAGFYSIVSQEEISILGPSGLLRQLGALSCPKFDRADLRIGFEPKFGYSTDSPQYIWLIDTLLAFDEPQRRAVVQFLTGSPHLPSGFQGLPKRLTVQLLTTQSNQPAGDSYLPVMQTCAGLFKLPRSYFSPCTKSLLFSFHDVTPLIFRYSSAEILREKLIFAINAKFVLPSSNSVCAAFTVRAHWHFSGADF